MIETKYTTKTKTKKNVQTIKRSVVVDRASIYSNSAVKSVKTENERRQSDSYVTRRVRVIIIGHCEF